MLSSTASPSYEGSRSGRRGPLSQELLHRADGALDRGELLVIEVPHEPFDGLDAHRAPACEHAQALRRRAYPDDAGVVAVGLLPRYARPLHLAHEPAHGRGTDLLGSSAVAERVGAAHEDGARR